MPRSVDQEGEDLLAYIEEGSSRVGRSVAIPSPEGRARAGWQSVMDLKVQPEVFIMMEQLREHPLFKGQWKTNAQVAWSMIYLGLKSCKLFYANDDGTWERYKSNFVAYERAALEHEIQRQQELFKNTAKVYRGVFHKYLDSGDAHGKYRAMRTLESMMETRDLVENKTAYDRAVVELGPVVIGQTQAFDSRIADYWTRLYPVVGGDLSIVAEREVYCELTTDYFDELNEIHNPPPEEE